MAVVAVDRPCDDAGDDVWRIFVASSCASCAEIAMPRRLVEGEKDDDVEALAILGDDNGCREIPCLVLR